MLLQLRNGRWANEIHSLKAVPHHNDRRVLLLIFDHHKGRWALELEEGRGKLKARPQNLKHLSEGAHTWQPSDEEEMDAIKSRGAAALMWTTHVPSEVCLKWVHARMSCGCKSIMDGVPPLFPGPPLWMVDVQSFRNSIKSPKKCCFLTSCQIPTFLNKWQLTRNSARQMKCTSPSVILRVKSVESPAPNRERACAADVASRIARARYVSCQKS